ncbi:DUF2267 domain-containing protein [Crocosphaera chwakensis]|uniref:DUF2267 domain-containing protein n=1 Tax=Crocosphaera chwakensis CCY0110 TaxID=391612 RepID=A3IQ50_9CHRO|nr:DUF2267 domain-containing protein [Crocosphaera chwakensis]EAZ91390.1 hypothetical protein CY0110_05452 [Crocosphaera chwakensis CCY0110]
MAEQTQEQQKTFLAKVIEQSGLENDNDAQAATKVVFRIMRDLIPSDQIEQIEQQLHQEAPKADMEIADLWNDPNVMVAFFSRVSPFRQLPIGSNTFFLRLDQEAALPEGVEAKKVTKAVFSALKDELPQQKSREIAQYLPDDIRQLWG